MGGRYIRYLSNKSQKVYPRNQNGICWNQEEEGARFIDCLPEGCNNIIILNSDDSAKSNTAVTAIDNV